jgi:L-fucose mutarotase/ribose pyranase (RbsD/FucU family)
MKILNGLRLKDNQDGTYTVSDNRNDLFTGNYNDCICVINHMGKRDNYHIPYVITDEQVIAFKDVDPSVQVATEAIVSDRHPEIVDAYKLHCVRHGAGHTSLYRFAEEYFYNEFKEAFDVVPYTKEEALKQLTKNIEHDFAKAGSKALREPSDADFFDTLGY